MSLIRHGVRQYSVAGAGGQVSHLRRKNHSDHPGKGDLSLTRYLTNFVSCLAFGSRRNLHAQGLSAVNRKGCAVENASRRIDVYVGQMFTIYVGTKRDLIREGLATEDMFPSGLTPDAHNLAVDVPRSKWWRMTRRKAGIYELRRWHDCIEQKKEPPEWDPVKFKKRIGYDFQAVLNVLISTAKGDLEESVYGTRIHKLSKRDIEQLRSLQYRCMEVIAQARVERGEPAKLRRIK